MSATISFKECIRPVLTLVIICLVVGGVLGLVNYVTAPAIAANEEKAALETYSAVLPDADSFTELELPGIEGVSAVLKADNGAGYVVMASARGYGGEVPAAVSFDSEGNIIDVIMTDNNETPGLGQKVVDPAFYSQFSGMTAEEIALEDIDAISGATISSRASVNAINRAIETYQALVSGRNE